MSAIGVSEIRGNGEKNKTGEKRKSVVFVERAKINATRRSEKSRIVVGERGDEKKMKMRRKSIRKRTCGCVRAKRSA